MQTRIFTHTHSLQPGVVGKPVELSVYLHSACSFPEIMVGDLALETVIYLLNGVALISDKLASLFLTTVAGRFFSSVLILHTLGPQIG